MEKVQKTKIWPNGVIYDVLKFDINPKYSLASVADSKMVTDIHTHRTEWTPLLFSKGLIEGTKVQVIHNQNFVSGIHNLPHQK